MPDTHIGDSTKRLEIAPRFSVGPIGIFEMAADAVVIERDDVVNPTPDGGHSY